MRRSLEDRFWSKVRIGEPDDCWEWTATRFPSGYGNFSMGARSQGKVGAHRVAYELANGPIPPGMDICHHCDNPPCCNPRHLYAGSVSDNLRDAVRRGRRRVPSGRWRERSSAA